MDKETAVVTGANGFVGSHLVDLLLEKGFNVKCIVRSSSNLQWLKNKPVELVNCGLNDTKKLEQVFKGAHYIYHIAGVVKSKKPEGYYEGNVAATRNLLEAALTARETLKKIVITGSLTATGPSPDGRPVTEETPCNPITTYGKSKLAQEQLAASYMDRLPITICRAPAVYGERDTEIFIYFQAFSRGITTTIGFEKKLVSLIHAKDLVNGHYLAAISPNSKGQTYFITSDEVYTWQQIGEVTTKVMKKKPVSIAVPHFAVYTIAAIAQFVSMFQKSAATLNIEKAKDITQFAWTCSSAKAREELGYRQQLSLEKGIAATVAWYKEMKWL